MLSRKRSPAIRHLVFAALIAVATISHGAEQREWNSKQGQTITAELVKDTPLMVHLKTLEGKAVKIRRSDLSDADQEYLDTKKNPKKKAARKKATLVPHENPEQFEVEEPFFGKVLTGSDLKKSAVRKCVDCIQDEIAKYTPDFIAQLGITNYVVVDELRCEVTVDLKTVDRDIPVVINRAGVAIISRDEYLRGGASYMAAYMHCMVGGILTETMSLRGTDIIAKFRAINGKDVYYEIPGNYRIDYADLSFEHPRKGILGAHAGISIEQDVTTVYAVLFVPRYYRELRRLAKKDEFIEKKIDAWIETLKEFGAGFDDAYCKKLWRR